MKKIIMMVLFIFCCCKTLLAGDFVCSDYNHNYAPELLVAIELASISGEPLTIHGICKMSNKVKYISSYPNESLTIRGDGKESSVLFFDFSDGDALTISGHEIRLPFSMSGIAVKRTWDGIHREGKNVLLRRVTDFSVDDVAIYGSNGFSLSIQDSQLGSVINSKVGVTASDMGCDGIHIEAPGTDITISNNTVYLTGDDGISVGSHRDGENISNVTIIGNTVSGSKCNGIKVHEGAKDVSVLGNVVRDVAMSCYVVETAGFSNSTTDNINFFTNIGHGCGMSAFSVAEYGSSISNVNIDHNSVHSYKDGFLKIVGDPYGVTETDNHK